MSFPLNAYCLAFVSALAVTLVALPLWRFVALKIGLIDNPGHRKIHSTPIPLAGGLAVATGLVLPLVAAVIFLQFRSLGGEAIELLSYGVRARFWQLVAIVVGAIGMLILGLLDDKAELKAGPKFLGQLLVALLVAGAGVRITIFIDNVLFSYLVTIFWILTLVNAFNFMDNMNGLCAGLGCISAGFFAANAGLPGQYLVALIALLVCGSLLGFLWYNYPNASAILGDSGSHLVGYLMAVLGILPHFYHTLNPDPLAVLNPLFILGVPLADLVMVVIIRLRIGQPIHVGDNNHLSHRLVRRGFSKPAAVALIWLLAVGLGGISLVTIL